MELVQAARWLADVTRELDPGDPVHATYLPLDYAWRAHEAYLERYGSGRKRALLVGMNPGPWGMGQTGVPFGEVELVRDWMGLGDVHLDTPRVQHEKRPVQGWDCTRSEVSGKRLWGLLREQFETAARATRDLFIMNHCPLLMFGPTGSNIIPEKLKGESKKILLEACDEGLRKVIDAIGAEVLVGVGGYARKRCERVADDEEVTSILHPSPASPLANKDGGKHWRKQVLGVLEQIGLV